MLRQGTRLFAFKRQCRVPPSRENRQK
ncbi:hypothetical protein RHECNPAF_750089 [Rhizobium etli CNPAF512]|nr:hypothetical protein RHECNPAF_750089 [Rhizobium etli CNPAF512]